MRHGITAALAVALPIGLSALTSAGTRATRRAQAAKAPIAAWVSAVTTEPKEVHLGTKKPGPLAVVTMQVAHIPLESPHTASLDVGTCSTDPPVRVEITYAPASQRITIPAGDSGVVVARAKVERADLGGTAVVKAMICASLSDPSPGIRVVGLRPDGPQAPLTIRNP